MRMRHKKNLDERLEKVSNYLITLRNDSLNFNDVENEKHLLDLKELCNIRIFFRATDAAKSSWDYNYSACFASSISFLSFFR